MTILDLYWMLEENIRRKIVNQKRRCRPAAVAFVAEEKESKIASVRQEGLGGTSPELRQILLSVQAGMMIDFGFGPVGRRKQEDWCHMRPVFWSYEIMVGSVVRLIAQQSCPGHSMVSMVSMVSDLLPALEHRKAFNRWALYPACSTLQS